MRVDPDTKRRLVRPMLLAAFAVLLCLPWVTTTGCGQAPEPPATYSGALLLAGFVIMTHGAAALGPVLLVAACALGVYAVRTRPRVLVALDVAAVVSALIGAVVTYFASCIVMFGARNTWHWPSSVAVVVLSGIVCDAIAVLAVTVARRSRVRASVVAP